MSRRKGRFIQVSLGECSEYKGLTLNQILVLEYIQLREEDGRLKGKQDAMALDLHMHKATFASASRALEQMGKLAHIERRRDHMIYHLPTASESHESGNCESQNIESENCESQNSLSQEAPKNKDLQEGENYESQFYESQNCTHESEYSPSSQYIEVQEPSKNPSPTPSTAEEGEGSDSIYFQFKDAPPTEVRTALKAAGLGWHGSGGYWYGAWTKERQALHDQYRPLFRSFDHGIGTERTEALVDKPSPPTAPSLPETDPQLRPVFDTLRAQVRADRYALWLAPLTATIEDDQVTLWAHSQLLLDQVDLRYRAQFEAATTDLFSKNTSLQIRLFDKE